MLEFKIEAKVLMWDISCDDHFQSRRHLWWLPNVRAPGRVAGERHGVAVVRRHDEQRLVELVGHHFPRRLRRRARVAKFKRLRARKPANLATLPLMLTSKATSMATVSPTALTQRK